MLLNWNREDAFNELFILRIDRGYFAYFPLRHTSFEITEAAYNGLKGRNHNLIEMLNSAVDCKEAITLRRPEHIKEFTPTRVDLAITTTCNLACLYCHAESNSFKQSLDERIAFAGVDFILNNARKTGVPYAQVGFNGGGEPTSKFDLMKKIISYTKSKAQNAGIKVRFGMATNCYYLNPAICDYVKNNFSHVSISIDGPEGIHNLHRPTLQDEDSFKVVFRNAKELYGNIQNFFLRATVSEKSVESLEDILSFFLTEFPNAGYSFMPINPLGRGATCKIKPPVPERYVDLFADILLDKRLCSLDKIFFMCGQLSTIRSTFCDAFSGPGFNVNVSGLLARCQRDNLPNTFYFGQIFKNGQIKIDYDKLNSLKEPRIFTDGECINCFAKYHCGGECMDLVSHNLKRCSSVHRWIAYQIKDAHRHFKMQKT